MLRLLRLSSLFCISALLGIALNPAPVQGQDAFITTWETISSGESITIPTESSGTDYDFTVDWGDGTTEEYAGDDPDPKHTYSSAGTHTVEITGTFPRIFLNATAGGGDEANAKKLMTIEQWGTTQWESMRAAFAGASNMTYNAADTPDLSGVTNMAAMFGSAERFNGAIGAWDVSNVTTMEGMFSSASSFNQPLDEWDVSSVTNMRLMFRGATSFNQDISQWDVTNVNDMRGMFSDARSFNQPIGSWDVSGVTKMRIMFRRATSFDQPIGAWDVSNVTGMSGMFQGATNFDQDISGWDVSNVSTFDGFGGGFLEGAELSPENYDALLTGWEKLDLTDGLTFDAGQSQFTSAAESARQAIIDDHNWTINDGGLVEESGPTITSVDPDPVIGSNAPQPFTINGGGFEEGANVTLRDLDAGQTFPNREISSFSPTEIVINPTFTTEPATWSVEVINPSGESTGEHEFEVVEPGGGETPAAPTGLAATAGDGEVSLSWDAGSESDLEGYNVYRSTTSFSDLADATRVNSSLVGSASYTDSGTDSGLENGTEYFYRVTAVDTDGNESGPSGQASATPSSSNTAPSAPTGLTAEAGDRQVDLAWDAGSESDLDGYNVYRSTSSFSDLADATRVNSSLIGSASYTDSGTDSGLENGTTYYYRVTAVDEEGLESDPSNEASATPEAAGPEEIAFGPFAVTADRIEKTGTQTYEASGSVSVEGIVGLEGPVTVDKEALSLGGTGAIRVIPSSVGRIYDGPYELTLPDASSTFLEGAGLRAANSALKAGDLDVRLSGLEVLTGSNPGIRVEGKLVLPDLLGAVEAEVSQLQITEGEGLALAGTIEVESVPFKNGLATLEELELTFNSVEDRFSGSAKLGLPIFGVGLGASASIIEGMLDSIALEVDLARPVPIPGTGMGLAGVGGGAEGLVEDPTELFISADIVPSAAGVSTRVVTLEDVRLTYTFDTKITGSGDLSVFEQGVAGARLTVVPRQKVGFKGEVGFSVPAAQQDVLNGKVDATLGKGAGALRLDAGMEATLVVPSLDKEGFPFGWIQSAAGLPYTVRRTENTLKAKPLEGLGEVQGSTSILSGLPLTDGISFAYGMAYDQGDFSADFARNMENLTLDLFPAAAVRVNSAARRANRFEGQSLVVDPARPNQLLKQDPDTLRQRFTLSRETPSLIVRVQSEAAQPDFSVTTPEGRTLTAANTGAPSDAAYTEAAAQNKTFATIKAPAQGEWSINLPDEGTSYEVDVIGANPAPALELAPPEQSGPSVGLSWEAEDPDDEASVDLYYDTDPGGQDGILIEEDLPEGQSSFSWNTSEVPTGTYYVYAVADDGENAPVVDYASRPVQVVAPEAPAAPTGVSATPQDTALGVSWSRSAEADRYTVYYAAGQDPTFRSSAAGVGDTSAVSLGGLSPGRTYHVAVSATDTTAGESSLSAVVTADYESETENNAPAITTAEPAEIAREGETYQQPVSARDADEDPLSYQLTEGPEGMSVGSSGTVSWAPESGTHPVEVQVSDPAGAADSLSWQVRAFGRQEAAARLRFSRSTYQGPGAAGQLALENPDQNRSSESIEQVRVDVTTGASSAVTELLLEETGSNTGRFQAAFGLGTGGGGTGGGDRPTVDVNPVDSLSATYEDSFPDSVVTAQAQYYEAQLISGSLFYPVESQGSLQEGRRLEGPVVEARQGGSVVAEASAGQGGSFELQLQPDQTYEVGTTAQRLGEVLGEAGGAVNIVDALRVAQASVGKRPFAGPFQKKAADVNGDGDANAVDALQIARRSVGQINRFEAGPWAASTEEVQVGSQNVSGVGPMGAEQGDANFSGGEESEASALRAVSGTSAGQKAAKTTKAGPSQEESRSEESMAQVPVRLSEGAEVGAFELKLGFEAETLSFEGASVEGASVEGASVPKGEVLAQAEGGAVQVGWFDRSGDEPLSIEEGGRLLTLSFRAEEGAEKEVALELEEGALSDPQAEPIEGAKIELPAVDLGAEVPEAFALQGAYPNPASGPVRVAMDLPEEAEVTVTVYNTLGQRVLRAAEVLPAGIGRRLQLETGALPSGQYFYRVEARMEGETRREGKTPREVQREEGRFTVVR